MAGSNLYELDIWIKIDVLIGAATIKNSICFKGAKSFEIKWQNYIVIDLTTLVDVLA